MEKLRLLLFVFEGNTYAIMKGDDFMLRKLIEKLIYGVGYIQGFFAGIMKAIKEGK